MHLLIPFRAPACDTTGEDIPGTSVGRACDATMHRLHARRYCRLRCILEVTVALCGTAELVKAHDACETMRPAEATLRCGQQGHHVAHAGPPAPSSDGDSVWHRRMERTQATLVLCYQALQSVESRRFPRVLGRELDGRLYAAKQVVCNTDSSSG